MSTCSSSGCCLASRMTSCCGECLVPFHMQYVNPFDILIVLLNASQLAVQAGSLCYAYKMSSLALHMPYA